MAKKANPVPIAKKPEWAPRFWEGCNLRSWLTLLITNRFAVHLSHLYIAVIVTFISFMHTILWLIQEVLFRQELNKAEIEHPPIFIIGHWRTGTTLLHELLIQDPRLSFPNTYHCLDPNHFLLTESWFTRVFRFLIPPSRPMDNMKAGFDRPQEDEFGLCMLGIPSPYRTFAFPNHPPQCQEYFELENLSPKELRSWKMAFLGFLKQVTIKTGKRLVLKSPPHTFRLPVLKDLFPKAIFIHIVRDPYVVFSSTVNLWRTLYQAHGLQTPNFHDLEDHVFETYLWMEERLQETRNLIDNRHLLFLRYEDLVKDPMGEMEEIYRRLDLGDFEIARPHLEEYLSSVKDYRTNRYELPPEIESEVTERWGSIIDRYGYTRRSNSLTKERPEELVRG